MASTTHSWQMIATGSAGTKRYRCSRCRQNLIGRFVVLTFGGCPGTPSRVARLERPTPPNNNNPSAA